MKTLLKLGTVILIIIVSCLLSISSFWMPEIQTANAPPESFSAVRAMKHVEQIAQVPHPVGSPAHDIVRDYVITELTKLGLKPQTQKASESNRLGGTVLTVNVENIWATLVGDNLNGQTILMVAHYDSTKNGPGAADDAMSVGALLETIRALKASTPLHNRVIFLFTDGEEDGLLGAKAFADSNPMSKDSTLVLNFEARGNTGPVIMFETGEENGWFMQEFQKAVPYPVAYSLTYDVYKRMPNDTDFTIFKNADMSGFNFAPIVGFETYHNKFDTPANLNQQTLQHLGSYAIALVEHFGDLELTDRLSGNAVYFTLARSILVLYSGKWVIPLALLAILLFVVVFAVSLRKKIITLKGILSGFLFSLLILLINAVVGLAGQKVFAQLYYNYHRQLTPEDVVRITGDSNFWIVGLLLLCGLIIAVVYHQLHKRLPFLDLIYGTLLSWAVLTIFSSIYLQGTSYLFVWPTIMVLVGLIFSLLAKDQESSFKHFPLFILGAVSCVFLYTPVIYLIFESMTINLAAAITVLAALPLSMIILLVAMFMQGPKIEISNLNNIGDLPVH